MEQWNIRGSPMIGEKSYLATTLTPAVRGLAGFISGYAIIERGG